MMFRNLRGAAFEYHRPPSRSLGPWGKAISEAEGVPFKSAHILTPSSTVRRIVNMTALAVVEILEA
jgi:hypothetical protein